MIYLWVCILRRLYFPYNKLFCICICFSIHKNTMYTMFTTFVCFMYTLGFYLGMLIIIIIIFHSQDLLSRNVLSNVHTPKAVSSHTAINRWSECIGPDRDSHHLGTLSTILQHFTHNEISLWNPVTHCCSPMSLCAAGCILHAKLTSLDT